MQPRDDLSAEQILSDSAWLRRLAARLVSDAAERDEVVQRVWLEALAHAPPTANLRPWLTTVARNVARMRFRSDARRRSREEAATEPARVVTPEELVDRVETERAVAGELLAVSEPYRTTLLLRYYEDLSAADIARRLGVPAATVRSRLKRGLDELRGRLDTRAGGDRRSWSLALVPTALLARSSHAMAIGIGGLLIMKTSANLVAAVALLVAFALGVVALQRRQSLSAAELSRAHAGVAWHTARGIGTSLRAPATLGGVAIPDWFGQRGAPIRRIAGRITVDGAPVADALVELGSGLSDAGVLPTATRRTAADGRFDFGVLPPARYTLAASKADHSPAVRELDTRDPTIAADRVELRLGGCAARLFGQVSDTSGGPIVGARLCYAPPRAAACVLSDGSGAYRMCLTPAQQWVEVTAKGYGAVDASVYPMNRPARRDFSLTPESIVVGRVVRADDGSPIARASVRSASGELGRRVAAPNAAVTDERGRFTLSGLAPGRHRLFAFANGLAAVDPTEVTVEAGRTSAEIVLRLGAAARISGVVTDGRQPVAGARISVDGGTPIMGGAVAVARVDAVTQPDGTFTLEAAPRGSVRFLVDGYEVASPTTLVLDRPQLEGVRVVVRALGSIAGHVTRKNRPVPDVNVDVGLFVGDGTPVVSDDDGAYVVRGLRAGKYIVNAEQHAAGIGGLSSPVMLAAGEQRTGVDLELSYAGAISGTVVEQDGTPASGVRVNFTALHKPDMGEALTGADGTFRLGTLGGNDDYRGDVRSVLDERHHFAPADGAYPTVFVPDNDSEVSGVTIVIKRQHLSIEGTTVDGNGQPVSDVHVVAFRAADDSERFNMSVVERPSAMSAVDGTFSIGDVDSGRFVLRARAGDGSEGSVNASAGQKGVVVPLSASGGIDGTLIGFATPPQVYARLDVSYIPAPRNFATVDDTGFHVRGLPPGPYLVDAGGDAATVQVDSGQIANVTLTNRGGGTIRGRVVDWRSGAPVEGLRCTPSLIGQQTFAFPNGQPGYSDADGNFTIEGVTAGELIVLCYGSPTWSDGDAKVTLAGGGSASCEVPVVHSELGGLGAVAWLGAEIGMDTALVVSLIGVKPKSPADRAGLRKGDVLASVDGNSVSKLTPLGNELAIRDHAPGTHVSVGVMRGGQPLAFDVVLGTENE